MKSFTLFFISISLTLSLICNVCHATYDGENINASLNARSFALLDSNSGELIASSREHERMPMASTTKIMTAIVAIEGFPLDEYVTICPQAVGVEGSSIYLQCGERLTMRQLLYALMLQSANDAAVAIAYSVSGGLEPFVDKMNEYAKELGLADTHFTNPHGLHNDEHYTTAYDMCRLLSYCMENADFYEITSTKRTVIPASDSTYNRLLLNHNKLLGRDGIIGGKTGYTKKSGRCLVTCYEKDGVRLCACTLDDPDDWADHRALYAYGIKLYKYHLLESDTLLSDTAHICGGLTDTVRLYIDTPLGVTLRDGEKISRVLVLKRFYYAPVKSGQVLGTLCYYSGQRLICSTQIKAYDTVEKTVYKKSLFEKILW